MLQKIRMSHLRNNEFLGFHKGVFATVTKHDPLLLHVVAPAAVYSGKINELESLYKMDAFNPLTAELEDIDFQRDEMFNGIVSMLAGFAKHFDTDMRDASHVLQRDLEKYGSNLVKGNYNAETIDLQNIIIDWRTKPELQNAVDMLGILEWVNELDRVNKLFDTKFLERTGSNAAKTDETATGKRADVVVAYDVLCKHLDSYAFLNDSELHRTTISEINELIDEYSVMLKQRRGRATKKTVGSQQ